MSFSDNPGNKVVRSMSGLSRLDTPRLYWPQYNPMDDAEEVMMYPGLAIRLLAGAEQARAFAESYRGFRVGAAALAVYRNGRTVSQRIVHGANAKPVAGSDIVNVHAEHVLMLNAEAYKKEGDMLTFPAFAVIGDLQPDQQSNEETRTLHPCGVCREAFEEQGSPVNPDTVCFTANPGHTTFEWFTIGALKKMHVNGDNSRVQFVEFEERPIALSSHMPKDGVLDMSTYETEEYIRSDQEVAQKLLIPILASAIARKLSN